MKWFLVFLLFPTIAFADKVKCEQNNMVWVEKWSDCVAIDPCVGERSEYCNSLFKADYNTPDIARAVYKLYAKLEYDMDDCIFSKVGDGHFACKSNDNYVVFVSLIDLVGKKSDVPDETKSESSYEKAKKERNRNEDLNHAVVQVCKLLGGTMDKEWQKKSSHKKEGLCMGASKRSCEKIGEWFDDVERACKIYDIKEILKKFK